MLEEAARLSAEYDMLPPGALVLCAVSGGADSMCLLHSLLERGAAEGFQVACAHFDHGIRGEASRRDAAFVRDWCAQRAVPFHLGEADVPAEAERRGLGLEETARSLRYDFFNETAARIGAARIATAHTADDNAETLLLHLVRGSGLQGLTGIAPRRGALVRPLLTTSRTEVEAYLEAHGVPHVEDATNADSRYARNKLRHEVMPLLRELNPRLTESLSAAAARLRGDNDVLNAQAANAAIAARPYGPGGWTLPAGAVARQPDPVAVRMVSRLLAKLGEYDFRAAHLQAVVALCRTGGPSASVDLPHGLTARRVYDGLVLERRQGDVSMLTIPLDPDTPAAVELGPWRLAFRRAVCPAEHPQTPLHAYLSLASLRGQAVLRPRQTGDAITLPHRARKRLKKLMIDAKVPRMLRDAVPVLADEGGVLYVPGFGPDAPHLAFPGEPAWEIAAAPAPPPGELSRQSRD